MKEHEKTNALLEDMADKFQAVIEAVQPIPEIQRKLDATFDEVGKLRVEMDAVKSVVKDHSKILEEHTKRFDRIDQKFEEANRRFDTIEDKIDATEQNTSNTVTRSEFEQLERRVEASA